MPPLLDEELDGELLDGELLDDELLDGDVLDDDEDELCCELPFDMPPLLEDGEVLDGGLLPGLLPEEGLDGELWASAAAVSGNAASSASGRSLPVVFMIDSCIRFDTGKYRQVTCQRMRSAGWTHTAMRAPDEPWTLKLLPTRMSIRGAARRRAPVLTTWLEGPDRTRRRRCTVRASGKSGGSGGIRTHDQRLKRALLYR
jgi:hypothetical protein